MLATGRATGLGGEGGLLLLAGWDWLADLGGFAGGLALRVGWLCWWVGWLCRMGFVAGVLVEESVLEGEDRGRASRLSRSCVPCARVAFA